MIHVDHQGPCRSCYTDFHTIRKCSHAIEAARTKDFFTVTSALCYKMPDTDKVISEIISARHLLRGLCVTKHASIHTTMTPIVVSCLCGVVDNVLVCAVSRCAFSIKENVFNVWLPIPHLGHRNVIHHTLQVQHALYNIER